MTQRRFGAVTVVAGVLLVGTVLAVSSGAFGRQGSVAADKLLQLVAAVLAMIGFLRGARRADGAERLWRLWFGAAMASLTVGLSAWIWGQQILGVQLPSSTLAPLGFLMTPVLATCGIVTLAHGGGEGRAETRPRPAVIVLDTVIVIGSLFVLAWTSAIESMVRTWERDGAGFATAVVAHPAAYLVAIVILVVLSWTHRTIRRLPMLLVALAFVAQSTSGWIFAYLVNHGVGTIPPLADAGFMTCPVLFALASVAPTRTPRGEYPEGRLRTGQLLHLVVPYLPLLVTCLFVVVGTATGVALSPTEIYVGLAVIVLVILRQLITLMDNIRLLERLHDSQRRLAHQAFHDPLTGVANRSLFQERLAAAVAGRHGTCRPLALLFVDVDGFKAVNDGFGHATGDAVLRTIAARLKGCVRAVDMVARLGGDEFGVLLDGDDSTPEQIGERVRGTLTLPHLIEGQQREVHASIGIVHLSTREPDITADELLGRADAAMYAAKRLGRGLVVVHGAASMPNN
ncbi:GGDEF domain-containing protein [Solihabitans fulvus]|uniref:GGDEF domain-containing protein n=1 Tax=Solihabitans fulvus TaxID=1892852 RepID=A0A5B2XF26_9PSEU|nr:GGDEF domain-containing protein [Solihabitans fulvus]KAA2261913.1 GGDEF domain-containing protein [Solihabitans fulvus]